MGRSKDKTCNLFDTEGTAPKVHLPTSDSRKPSNTPNDKETTHKEESTTRGSAVLSSNGYVDATTTRHTQTSPVQPQKIKVNIPSSGRYKDPAGSSTNKATTSSSNTPAPSGGLGKGPGRGTSTKAVVKARRIQVVPTPQPVGSRQFRASLSGKARVVHSKKPKASKSQRLTMNPPNGKISRHPAIPSLATSPAPTHLIRPISIQNSSNPSSLANKDPVQEGAAVNRVLGGDGTRRTSPSNIYSTNPSHPHDKSHNRQASASHAWKEFATMNSGQNLARTPSHSPPKASDAQPRSRNIISRQTSSPQHPQSMRFRQHGCTAARRWADWQSWPEVRVKVFGLTPDITTADMWKCFSKEGTVITIELFEDARGARDGKGMVRFR